MTATVPQDATTPDAPSQDATSQDATEICTLDIGGMTCASCAAKIEKRLNAIDGVAATVNYATGTATVAYDPAQVAPDALVATVEATGYTAELPAARS